MESYLVMWLYATFNVAYGHIHVADGHSITFSVVLAGTKDHLNWELLAQCAEKAKGDEAKALKEACEEVEEQEDQHLYHSQGWCHELWIASLGMPAVLPPPEEEKAVKTAIGAARAQQARAAMLKK
jgi:hypothetical protein